MAVLPSFNRATIGVVPLPYNLSKAGAMSTLLALPLRQRVTGLRWALPLAIGLLAVGYELGPGRWIHDAFGASDYFDLDILFYATAAPLLAYWVLTLITHWLDEKDHAEQLAEIRRLNANLNEQVAARTAELAEKVTQLARANAELQRLDQTRNEFVSLVSHQIRAPLTNIRGAVERMGTDCAAVNTTCLRMFGIMNQQAERLEHLVRDVLSAARLEAGELRLQAEPISLLP